MGEHRVHGPDVHTVTRSPRAPYEVEQVWAPWSEQLPGGWGDDFHALLLGDELRMRAYAQAIHEVVEPGMVVLDLGTGTGILARWALEAGAHRVLRHRA